MLGIDCSMFCQVRSGAEESLAWVAVMNLNLNMNVNFTFKLKNA